MKHLYIAVLQQKHVNHHFLVHHAPIEENWKISGEGRNELKSCIKETKGAFYNKMLS